MSTARGSCWSVTINNPISADEENINLARQKGWKVEGQLEKGENGTPHYQLMVKTPQVRFSSVKKQFPRAHIEVARNVAALESYVNKEETRVDSIPTTQAMYPSQQMLMFWYSQLEFETEREVYCRWCKIRAESVDYKLDSRQFEEEYMLGMFDDMIREKIVEGYVVENMGVNPFIRNSIKKYGRAIVERGLRQTDRQTDSENNSVVLEINASSCSSPSDN